MIYLNIINNILKSVFNNFFKSDHSPVSRSIGLFHHEIVKQVLYLHQSYGQCQKGLIMILKELHTKIINIHVFFG